MTKTQKIFTSILMFFTLVPGLVKFTDRFREMFTIQIAESNLPFPSLSFVAGQGGEIVVGLLLFSLLFSWKRFPEGLAEKLFVWGNLFVIPIMLVAVYVHLHPAVPAEVLPFESKPPFLAVLLLILVGLNLFLQKMGSVACISDASFPIKERERGLDIHATFDEK